MLNYGSENYGLTRYGMNIDYVPVTIGADDGTPYELIFATLDAFKATWGTMDQNYVIHFSDPLNYVSANDPQLAPYNESLVYYVKTTGAPAGDSTVYLLTPRSMNYSLSMGL